MPKQASSSLSSLLTWEPALSQLRDLSPGTLDRHVADWLRSLNLVSIRATERNDRCSTYTGRYGQFPVDVTVGCRVYQRRNRLQVHQVESFLGSLVRQGLSAGVLVTTGEFSREAYRVAAEIKQPRIRLIAGPEWLADLAQRKVGLKRRCLATWLLDRSYHQRRHRCSARSECR